MLLAGGGEVGPVLVQLDGQEAELVAEERLGRADPVQPGEGRLLLGFVLSEPGFQGFDLAADLVQALFVIRPEFGLAGGRRGRDGASGRGEDEQGEEEAAVVLHRRVA